ncbi:MAG: hypothetical protein KAI79_06990 [Bacteroidales bacterium]|nr:hypothetical protein [Bacteroidales bacterium]
MKRKVKLYEQEEVTNLFKLTVQNDWNEDYFIRLISKSEIKIYIKDFGLKIIKEHQFLDWYSEIKRQDKKP